MFIYYWLNLDFKFEFWNPSCFPFFCDWFLIRERSREKSHNRKKKKERRKAGARVPWWLRSTTLWRLTEQWWNGDIATFKHLIHFSSGKEWDPPETFKWGVQEWDPCELLSTLFSQIKLRKLKSLSLFPNMKSLPKNQGFQYPSKHCKKHLFQRTYSEKVRYKVQWNEIFYFFLLFKKNVKENSIYKQEIMNAWTI